MIGLAASRKGALALLACAWIAGCSGGSGSEATSSGTSTVRHGMELDASNTGVPAGRSLAEVARTIVVDEAWIADSNGGRRFLQDRRFLDGARLEIKASDFTVRYCSFEGRSGASVDPGLSDVVFEWSEFDGRHLNRGGDCALGIWSFTARRLHVHRWPRAFWCGWGDLRIEECYVHDLTADGGDAHLENAYIAGGADLVFARNRFVSNEVHVNGDSRLMTSASLAIYNEDYAVGPPFPAFPALERVVVADNYFETDGHFALYCGALSAKGGARARDMVVTGNVFGRGLHPRCGLSGPAVAFDPSQPGNVWRGNTWGPPGAGWTAGDPAEGDSVPAPSAM